MHLQDLQVRQGDPILPAWKRLLAWARQFRLEAGKGIRLTRTPNGTYIVAEPLFTSWDHPFKVTVSDGQARVLPGTLNSEMPLLGGKALDAEPVPALRLTGGPNGDLRSWLCLDVEVEENERATITHTRELEHKHVGRHPLAMLVWNPDRATVRRVHQITHFNLQHRLVKGASGRPDRHFFWPA